MTVAREDKMKKEIMRLTSMFLASISNRTSLITVTRVTIAPDFKRATIGVSVLPEDKETQAIEFLKRRTRDLRGYIMSHLHTRIVPQIEIVLDEGEKNRQRIEKLLRGEDEE